MGARENLQRLIDKKRQEIGLLEESLRDAQTYVQALSDAVKTLPRDAGVGSSEVKPDLRPDTMVYRIREMLRKHGKPMHVTEILAGLNRTLDKNNRVSVSGSLAAYVRSGHIFTRPKPNTFGLLEMTADDTGITELPDSFGT